MTSYEAQATKELEDLMAYVRKHNMEDDDFAKEEIARLEERVAQAQAQPTKWITATCSQQYPGEVIDQYLGFGAAVHMFLAAKRTTIAIIQVPAEHAEWQSMRLASGMLGGHIYETAGEAMEAAEMLQSLASA